MTARPNAPHELLDITVYACEQVCKGVGMSTSQMQAWITSR